VALALGVLLRHERLAPASFAGSLVVLAGVWLGIRAPRAAGAAPPAAPGAPGGPAADHLAPPRPGE